MKRAAILAAALALSTSGALAAQHKPGVGACVDTKIRSIHTRLWDQEKGADFVEAGGVSLSFENGVYLTSYGDDSLRRLLREGDTVKLCLVSRPKHGPNCPVGDERGWMYHFVDTRNGISATLMNSEHDCGGA
jgi:hypothetical protein